MGELYSTYDIPSLEIYSTYSTPLEEEKPPKNDSLELPGPVHTVVKKISMMDTLTYLRTIYLGELEDGPVKTVVRKISVTQFEKVPLEEWERLRTSGPLCSGDWLRVVFLASICDDRLKDQIITFINTTNLRDVCRYLGMKMNHQPHYYMVELVKGDKIVHINPYDTSHSVVAPKGSTVFVWTTHYGQYNCTSRRCNERCIKTSIEKYRSANDL